jgi:hypothetical protein
VALCKALLNSSEHNLRLVQVYVAGAGVAAGYLHAPAAAPQRFHKVSGQQLLFGRPADSGQSILFGEGAAQWLLQRPTGGGL